MPSPTALAYQAMNHWALKSKLPTSARPGNTFCSRPIEPSFIVLAQSSITLLGSSTNLAIATAPVQSIENASTAAAPSL
ncbi:hypothetical protein C7458_11710 [Williamsia muralis]|nr:hypothetical protein C7458_11710 [Williamsia marianensis]